MVAMISGTSASIARLITGLMCSASRKKPKWRLVYTPAAAPMLIAVLNSSSVTGSVQLGESLIT
ncbi:hypothetical protein D3C81_2154590 [compost metagenome]